MDVFRYNLIYESFFGGVSAVTATMFKEVNGFSNRFFGETISLSLVKENTIRLPSKK